MMAHTCILSAGNNSGLYTDKHDAFVLTSADVVVSVLCSDMYSACDCFVLLERTYTSKAVGKLPEMLCPAQ